MWGAGDYPAVADKIAAVGEHAVEAAGVEPGLDVLDVACGAGNATIPAALAGARVTGLDLSPVLLDEGRRRTQAAGAEIEWLEGDAQALPFADGSFDRVISTFGHMFAPDHERTAAELLRVVRLGGTIAICCWTPEGSIGRMFRMTAGLIPPPPGARPPSLWGTEQHVSELLGDATFERRMVEWRDESVERYADFMLDSFGPLLNAREALGEREGELRPAYIAYLEGENLAGDGSMRFDGEYLTSVVRT